MNTLKIVITNRNRMDITVSDKSRLFLVIWLFNLLYLSVPDEGYSSNSS